MLVMLIVPWVVFSGFLAMTLFTERTYLALCAFARYPARLSAGERQRIASGVPTLRPLVSVAALATGLLAIAATVQALL